MKTAIVSRSRITGLTALLLTVTLHTGAQQFALSFDGVNDYVAVSNTPALQITNTITVEAWINRAAKSIQMGIVEKYGPGGGTDGGYALRIQPTDNVRFYTLDNGSTSSSVDGATALGTNEWYHVAGVWDGTNLMVYVNGVLDGSFASPRNPKSGTTPLIIGNRGYALGTAFAGEIDEVRIWDIARTQHQIAVDMTRSLSGTESGLVAYWRFDEGSGTNAADSAPAGGFSDGLLVNGQGWVNSPVPTNVPFLDALARLPGVWRGAAAWGDFDDDGRLDILLTGTTNAAATGAIARLYRSTGNGSFSLSNSLPGLSASSVAWGDFDNDGALDLALMGNDTAANKITAVYQGNANGAFLNLNANLPAVTNGAVAWADFDNDGRPDILLTGSGAAPISRVYRNDGGGLFADINANLPGLGHSAAAWGDFDSDGNLDIVLTGEDSSGDYISRVYHNDGNGSFTLINASLLGLAYGSAAWGDYDNDGHLDLLLTGEDNAGQPNARIYHNNGNGAFTDINANLPGVEYGVGVWGDYDNDGHLDVLLMGQGSSGDLVGTVFRNNGSGTFTDVHANLPGAEYCSAAWGDFDNDGDLDLLLTGLDRSGNRITRVYRNTSAVSNSPPTAPTGLSASLSNSVILLSWASASDTETPVNGLTYSLRVGTSPQGADVVSPLAGLATGYRRVPQLGNLQHGTTAQLHLAPGRPYYWSVQAVDGALAGSAFSAEGSFGLGLAFSPVLNPGSPIPGDGNGDGIVDASELDLVLSNYWPYSPWLQMTNVAGLGGTNVTFALTNSMAGSFTVQYSTDLANWLLLGQASPRYEFTDTNAPAVPQRFYRLRWP